jgi:hypothetical protein
MTPSAFSPDAPDWTVGHLSRQLSPPLPNGLHILPCDLRQQFVASISHSFGLHSGIPAPLLLIQSAHQQIHLVMQLPFRMVA